MLKKFRLKFSIYKESKVLLITVYYTIFFILINNNPSCICGKEDSINLSVVPTKNSKLGDIESGKRIKCFH